MSELNQLEEYVLLVLVVWRLTHLISAEDGPFEIIFKLRKLVGNSFLGKLMDCFYCLSIWIGLLCALYVAELDPIKTTILALYYSGASIILERLTNKNFE